MVTSTPQSRPFPPPPLGPALTSPWGFRRRVTQPRLEWKWTGSWPKEEGGCRLVLPGASPHTWGRRRRRVRGEGPAAGWGRGGAARGAGSRAHRDVMPWLQQRAGREAIHAHGEVAHQLLQHEATQVGRLLQRMVEDAHEPPAAAHRHDLQAGARGAGAGARAGALCRDVRAPPTVVPLGDLLLPLRSGLAPLLTLDSAQNAGGDSAQNAGGGDPHRTQPPGHCCPACPSGFSGDPGRGGLSRRGTPIWSVHWGHLL